MDAETIDSDGGHSNSTNPSRFTCQVAGSYLVAGGVAFASNTTGNRQLRIMLNGSTNIPGAFAVAAAAAGSNSGALAVPPVIIPMVVGDYVEVHGFQSSGGALSTTAATDVTSSLTVLWISS